MSDLISRQNAIDEANAWLLECFKVQKQDRSCGLIRRLEDLPSMQVPSYVAEIEAEYKKAVSQPWVRKPLAKALYEVWKKHDREDVSRHEREEE